MKLLDRLDRRFPRFAFGRHVPPGRIAVRIRRRLQAKLAPGAHAHPHDARLAALGDLPDAVFPPRPIRAARGADGWTFEFLGRAKTFADAIDWAGAAGADDQLWRMNLHYMEYLEVCPPADGGAAILSWIAGNPPTRPGAWYDAWNAYALSLRVVCWMQWLARHGSVLTAPELAAVEASLASQLAWLARHPETDLGGNHLVKNIKALLWGAACFSGREARHWGTVGRDLLRQELAQVLSDGMHFERSPSYHNQVAADLIEVHAVLRRHTAIRLDAKIEAMVRAAMVVRHPDGAPAQFGDAGLTMAYDADALAEAWQQQGGHVARPDSAVLRDGGLAAFHSDGFTGLIRCGPIGADALPAHAHGDAGSVELSLGTRRLVVDQGVFEYVDGPRRRASRAASSHNLTAADGADMAGFFGAFRLGYRPHVRARRAQLGRDGLIVDIEHDGFSHVGANCGRGVVVRRLARFAADQIVLDDAVEGAVAGAGWTSRFLIHPDWSCEVRDDVIMLVNGDLAVRFEADAPARVEPAVWWPDMGRECATRRIVVPWAGRDRLSMRFVAA